MSSVSVFEGQTVQPRVSVIMNCFNSARYLREAIDSIYAQSFTDWEIIFWDNVSSDDSATIAQSYGDGRLRYFRGETTVPLGHARNLAIAKSRGEFIAFLDCDDIWLPEKLQRQIPLFLADREVGLVYSDTYFFNDKGFEKRLYSGKSPYRGNCFPQLLNNYVISLETAMVRRSALDSLDHWFDLKFNMIEEHDLFVRIGLDWKIDYSPDVLAKWRIHGESLTFKEPDSFIHETRSMLEDLQNSPKIRDRYASELSSAWRGLALAEAKMHWKKGNGVAARASVLKNSAFGMKALLVGLASFFPYTFVERVHRAVFGSSTPR